MSCTSCLSNSDIQTPDQVSVLRYIFTGHIDSALEPLVRDLHAPLEGGGPSTYAARDASLYNARPLLRDLHYVIQLMSIAGYEAYVYMCSSVYKTLCAAFIWLPWDARSRRYVCLYRAKKYYLINTENLITKMCCNRNEKHF